MQHYTGCTRPCSTWNARSGVPKGARVRFKRGENKLARQTLDLVDEACQMLVIQLRGGIIQQQGRSRPARALQHLELGQDHRGRDQFLLAAREVSRAACPPTCTRTSARCGPAWVRPRWRSRNQLDSERLREGDARGSSRARIAARHPGPQAASRCRASTAPCAASALARASLKAWPWRRSSGSQARAVSGADRKAALRCLQRTGVAQPGIDEMRFHVEHTPVEPAPAPRARLLDELMDAGLDDLNGEGLRELAREPHRDACNLALPSAAREPP